MPRAPHSVSEETLLLDPVPGNALIAPTKLNERVALIDICGVVVGAGLRIRVVLAIERHALVIVRVPAHALAAPALLNKDVTLVSAQGVVVVTTVDVWVVEAPDGRLGL